MFFGSVREHKSDVYIDIACSALLPDIVNIWSTPTTERSSQLIPCLP